MSPRGWGWDGMGGPDVLAALIEVVIISGHVWGWDGDGMGGPDVLTRSPASLWCWVG